LTIRTNAASKSDGFVKNPISEWASFGIKQIKGEFS
jgi:hypothetical protein